MYRGIVQKGAQCGAGLGFPTVNIPLSDENVSGIYAAWVVVNEKTYSAAVYADQNRKLLEAHLLDFAEDLYGREIEVELLEKIREDKKFENEDELRAAIADDVAKVREYFKNDVG